MDDVQASTGTLIPFPGAASRPTRPALRAGERRGEILLFTGVRYERSLEPTPAPSGEAKPGRRRRRS